MSCICHIYLSKFNLCFVEIDMLSPFGEEDLIAMSLTVMEHLRQVRQGPGSIDLRLLSTVLVIACLAFFALCALKLGFECLFSIIKHAIRNAYFLSFLALVPTIFLLLLALQVNTQDALRQFLPQTMITWMEGWANPRGIFQKCGLCSFNRATCRGDPKTSLCPMFLVVIFFAWIVLLFNLWCKNFKEEVEQNMRKKILAQCTQRVHNGLWVQTTETGKDELFELVEKIIASNPSGGVVTG